MLEKGFKRLCLFVLLVCCLSATAYASGPYTDDELCDMAKHYYADKNNGYIPTYANIEDDDGGEVIGIRLFEYGGNMRFTSAQYTINRNTGKGTEFDVILGKVIPVDLTPYAPNKSTDGLPFQDVRKSDWFYDSVKYVYQNGLFSGTSSSKFSPDQPMNRAMLATVLYRLAGQPAVSGFSGFDDVEYHAYYTDAVIWANARGIITGTGGSTFSPQTPVTHEQLAVLLYRYAVLYHGMDSAAGTDLSGYPDGGQVGDYAKKAVVWCVTKGIITDGVLTPKSNASRAEVAAMLYRLSRLSQGGGTGYRQTLENLFANQDQYAGNRSMYCDVDNDGTEELFTVYTNVSNTSLMAAVYTIRSGQSVCLMNENAMSLASAPVVSLGTIAQDGNRYVCLMAGNSGYGYPGEHDTNGGDIYKIYSFSNMGLSLIREVNFEYIRHGDDPVPYESNITITENGQTRSINYSQFQSWLGSWKWLDSLCLY